MGGVAGEREGERGGNGVVIFIVGDIRLGAPKKSNTDFQKKGLSDKQDRSLSLYLSPPPHHPPHSLPMRSSGVATIIATKVSRTG